MTVSGRHFLKVRADLTNTGASKIPFDLKRSALSIFLVESSPPSFVDRAEWKEVATLDMTVRHRWIEGGESTTLNWLVELPLSGLSAVRAELRVAGKRTSWYADTITENEPIILSVTPQQDEENIHESTRGKRPGLTQRSEEDNADREGGERG